MNLLASLRNRVFLASVLLAALTIGFAIYQISARVIEQAERELERGLSDSAALLEQQHTALSELFLLRARLVADLPRLKSAVDTRDPATVRPLALDYQRQLNADFLLVTDREGRVLFGSGEAARFDRAAVDRALGGEEAAAFWPHPEGLFQVVTVPIAVGLDVPDILGTLSAGFLLGDRRAEDLQRLAASDIAFAVSGRIQAATVPPHVRQALQGHIRGDRTISHVTLGDEDYVVTGLPLTLPVRMSAGDEPAPIALVLRSRSSHLRALRTIQSSLLAAAGLAVALAIVLSYVVARSVTTPLGTITAEMREMARTGDLTRKIRLRGPSWSQDEDARVLATAFNTLTDSIGQFQRQSAQKERLLSLGRLSTVIAHEVRNPLMIIKGSLRPLQSDAVPGDVREAASDIDEQVGRLDRIVHDVLDFARPLQFELLRTDLGALCRDAAAAASNGQAGIRVDTEPLAVVTDPERLRSALINVLTNARQSSREPSGTDDVVLTARRGAPGRVRIVIRDQGAGIAPEHVPHVFEPYFTTRRSGSGLGLPISRNIIEGLGGVITVQPGHPGTIVEIDLPETAAPVSEAPHA